MPSWRVAEQFSEARDAQKGNEDGYVLKEHCIAVLDGVSARDSKERVYGLTPGQFAVQIGEQIMASPDTNSRNVVTLITRTLHDAVGGFALEHTPSFVFVAFFPQEHVIVRVGDCSYLVDGMGHNPGLAVDRAKTILRQRSLKKMKNLGYSEDELLADTTARDRLRGLQAWQEHYSNNPTTKDLGYGVINGNEVPEDFIERIAVPIDAKEIVLASDGYPPEILKASLAETETALRVLQHADPLAIGEVPGTRPHRPANESQRATDDRTYVRLER